MQELAGLSHLTVLPSMRVLTIHSLTNLCGVFYSFSRRSWQNKSNKEQKESSQDVSCSSSDRGGTILSQGSSVLADPQGYLCNFKTHFKMHWGWEVLVSLKPAAPRWRKVQTATFFLQCWGWFSCIARGEAIIVSTYVCMKAVLSIASLYKRLRLFLYFVCLEYLQSLTL